MTVAIILKEKGERVYTATASQTLSDATAVLRERRIGAVVVVDARALPVGVLSERDIVRALAEHGASVLERPISDFMSADVITCTPANTIDEIMEIMTENRIRHVPVVEDGRLIGIVSIGDVVRMKILAAEAEAEALKSYITS